MFAIALWDETERRLLLARDRFGIKPLFHAQAGDALAFASELKALRLAPGFDETIDPEAVDAFLAFNSIPAPLTIFASARKLPPGHLLVPPGRRDGTIERFGAPEARRRRPRCGARTRPRWPPSCARPCATRCAPTSSPTCRWACSCRAAWTRRCCAHWPPRSRASECRRSRSASRSARSTSSTSPARMAERYRTDHHELILKPDAAAAAARDRRVLRRAVRRQLGAADVPGLPAGVRAREGGPVRRGRRRALRRLRDLRGRPALRARTGQGGAHRQAVRRAPAELIAPSVARVPRQALRARRAPTAARAPPRLEGDLRPRRARGPAARRARRPRPARTSTASATPRPRARSRSRGYRTSTSASTSSTTCW